MRLMLAALMVGMFASMSGAQVIYLPVQYQYGHGEKYYYGGDDPYVFAAAERVSLIRRLNHVHREPVRVYSDLFPFWNAALFGFTPTHARNEAYWRTPRYFTKAELYHSAVEIDGVRYVPPSAPVYRQRGIYNTPRAAAAPAAVRPAEERGVIIIIPKKAPQKRDPDARPAMFVSAS